MLNVCVAACLFKQPDSLKQQKKVMSPTCKVKRLYEENILNAEESVGILKGKESCKKGEYLPSALNNLKENDGNVTCQKRINKKRSCGPNFNFSLFGNPRFSLYWVACMLCVAGYGSNFILIPSQIRALGYGKLSVSTAVAITGGSEIFARIFAGWLADKNLISPKSMLAICYLISAIFTVVTPHIHSLYYMYFYATIIGVFPASFWSLVSVLIIDVVGMKDFPSAIGLVSLALALGYSVSQMSIGKRNHIVALQHY